MIEVVVDDLASVPADAVVRPATDVLAPALPSDAPLDDGGGPVFTTLLRTDAPLPIGSATVTAGGDLVADFVVHAVIRTATDAPTRTGVARALESVLHRAQAWNFDVLVLPPLGTGPDGLTLEAAASVMCDTLRTHRDPEQPPSVIKIVVASDEDKAVFAGRLRELM